VFQRSLYAIQLNPKPPAVRALEHRGIKVIAIATDPELLDAEKDVEEWIRQFSSRLRVTERRRRYGVSGGFDGQGEGQPADSEDPVLTSALFQSIPPRPFGVSRDALVDRILQCLGSRYHVVVLAGAGGFGKTHLALKVAWMCRYPDRLGERRDVLVDHVAWVPFAERRSSAQHQIDAVIDAIARATGSYALIRERDPERRRRGAMRLLLGHRCLVVLDNFNGDDPELNAWLEEVPEPSRVLVTTRRASKVSGLTIEVPGLTDEEARRLLEGRTRRLRLFFGPKREAVFEGIRKATAGNPQAMRLLLGLLKIRDAGQPEGRSRADEIVQSFVQRLPRNASPVEMLFAEFWDAHLDEDARRLLHAAAVLSDTSSSFRPEMLYAALEPADEAKWARISRVCLDTGLLERRPAEERYIMRPQIRALVFGKAMAPDAAAEARWAAQEKDSLFQPLLSYVVPLVERVVSREMPPEEYWNALVTDAMIELDPDILLVLAVAQWAVERSSDKLSAIHLVVMLTHYLDSRFRHNERIELVRSAIGVLRDQRRGSNVPEAQSLRREALFLIDALGWTYLDQGAYDAALREIESGESLLPTDETCADLRLIASAWRAEAHAAKGAEAPARQLLDTARHLAGTDAVFDRKPWIAMRFEMACGDVDLLSNTGDARAHYRNAAGYASLYGDEGRGYQWRPRLALAHVLTHEVGEARKQFEVLADQTEVELARLHGRYGLALLAIASAQDQEGRAKADRIRAEIERRAGASSLLMRLFEKVSMRLSKLAGSEGSSRPRL
jgi:hypothetical protein